MTDVMLLWDTPLLFEKLFIEYNIKCQRVSTGSMGTPFLPPCKCLIIPTGFANPAYTKILSDIVRNKKKIHKFVENGGTLLIFGPMVEAYEFDWLPMKLKYIQRQMSAKVCKANDEVQCLVEELEHVEFDGYFTDVGGDVLLKDEDGNALMVSKKVGEGMIFATTIHELPSEDFLKRMVQHAKSTKL